MKKPNIDIPTSSKIKFEDSESSSDDEGEIEKELANVTFEELQKARSDGSHAVYQKPKLEKKGGRENKNSFQKRYSFLYDSELPAEKEDLMKLMKKSNDPEVISGLKDRLSWIDKQLKSVKTKRSDKEILAEHKKKEREAAKQGKQPYYLKKSEIKKQTLIEKYKDLKASGKLESFLEKRRKKSAAKDRRFMPYRRSNDE